MNKRSTEFRNRFRFFIFVIYILLLEANFDFLLNCYQMTDQLAEPQAESAAGHDNAEATPPVAAEEGKVPSLSKNQQKKRARLERKLALRQERRQAERARLKERKRAAKARGQPASKRTRVYAMNESRCRLRVAVDMAYDQVMDATTVQKTVRQLVHCYAANRRSPNPLQYYIVNLDGKAKEIFDRIPSYQQWDAHLMHQPLRHLWSDKELVYLTADSDNVLTDLEEQKVYVIGGLLDHNHQKGLCLRKAQENGWAHAKLPIDNFVRLSTRKVLAINHVFEILVHYTREQNWERAFMAVIPKRKGVEQLDDDGDDEIVELAETPNGEIVGDDVEGASNSNRNSTIELLQSSAHSSNSTIGIDSDDDDGTTATVAASSTGEVEALISDQRQRQETGEEDEEESGRTNDARGIGKREEQAQADRDRRELAQMVAQIEEDDDDTH